MLRILYVYTCLFAHLITYSQQPKLVLPVGHSNALSFVGFSPDGMKILTTSQDKTAKIWDAKSGALLLDIKGHENALSSGAFSPDSKTFIITSVDETASICEISTGNILHKLKGHTGSIRLANFSTDGSKIITASEDSTARLWDAKSGKLLKIFSGHQHWVYDAVISNDGNNILTVSKAQVIRWNLKTASSEQLKEFTSSTISGAFSNDGRMIITSSNDGDVKIRETESGKSLLSFKAHDKWIRAVKYSKDDKKIVTVSADKTAKVWDATNGRLINTLHGYGGEVLFADFDNSGNKLFTLSADKFIKVWDLKTNKLLYSYQRKEINGNLFAAFNPNGHKLIISPGLAYAEIIDLSSGVTEISLRGRTSVIFGVSFSPDGKKFTTSSSNGTVKIWSAESNQLLVNITSIKESVHSANFSPDSKKIVTSSQDTVYPVKIWDAQTGRLLLNLKGHTLWSKSSVFSPDGTQIASAYLDKTIKLWDATTGKMLKNIKGHQSRVWTVNFSPDGKKIVSGSDDSTARIWNIQTGQQLAVLKGHLSGVNSAAFTQDGFTVMTSGMDGNIKLWDAETGVLKGNLKKFNGGIWQAAFNAKGDKIVVASLENINTLYIINANTGKTLTELHGHTNFIFSAAFSPDDKMIVSGSGDNFAIVWNLEKNAPFYSLLPVDINDYLITNKDGCYDGTENARKLLYFSCGTDIIELEQLKEQIWVPNLAYRCLRSDIIGSKTLRDLNVCGLTPEIEERNGKEDEYQFLIHPKTGGLGEIIVYINGIEVRRYKKDDLKKNGSRYELVIKKQELAAYCVPGQQNPVIVKAWVANNSVSSRGLIIKEDKTKETATTPNLFAVMVGVSDYKGEELDLKYAAKDASDFSKALSIASRKLLNSDGKEHVFTYNLTTQNDRYLLPEKNSIKKTLEEIGKRATPNDIVLIFFAGHGVMAGNDKKQFYFVTADASKASSIDAIADVGISTTELTEWMKPANIKAQKRILIFDACNSGQAIRDFVQLGNPDQGYIAARNDEKSQQIKAIEKLNNQSGLIILAASASDQSAYEMGRYSQGLLTYSLLKVMKQQPEILENGKYLDVSNWLNAAKKMVSILAEGTGARQEPQLSSNNNFNIGLIDEEVRNKIILSEEKALFTRSNFQNADTKIDNLKLRTSIDKELMNISNRGNSSDITYSADYDGAEAFALTGDYKITGDSIIVSVLLIKAGAEIKYRYEIKGTASNLSELTQDITTTALDWLKKNK